MIEYTLTLVEWVGNDETPDWVSFRTDLDKGISIDRVNDKVVTNVAHILNLAKQANPSGLYIPIAPTTYKNGAEIRVPPDGFNLLKDDIELLAMGLLDEYQEGRIRNPGGRR